MASESTQKRTRARERLTVLSPDAARDIVTGLSAGQRLPYWLGNLRHDSAADARVFALAKTMRNLGTPVGFKWSGEEETAEGQGQGNLHQVRVSAGVYLYVFTKGKIAH